jgi:hypothetical protein
MALITGKERGSGLTWTLGHPDLFVKRIVIVWMGTGIKKQHNAYPQKPKPTGGIILFFIHRLICIKSLKNW